ncbi:MAG: YabP/YqfC family sporulation protein [Clostridia bacterium]|nr:YabP/YqfC family sporulation protein [Clostridia bacterium]
MARRRRRNEACKNESPKMIGSELSIPISAATMAHIEICGNREAIVEGCRGVLEYDDTLIKLDTGKLIITFTGSELCLGTFQLQQTVIRGNIVSIDFSN